MQAILFDMDGTLLDSEGYWSLTPLLMLNHFHIPYNPQDIPWYTKTSFRRSLHAYIGSSYDRLGKSFEECEKWCMDFMYSNIYGRNVAQLKPHALDTLQVCKNLQIPMCLLSATEPVSLKHSLERTGMISCFRYFQSTVDHPINKTTPDFFIESAHRLGFDPQDCLVIEDSLYAMKTAAAAGCTVWAIEDIKHTADVTEIKALAQRYFKNHIELSQAIRSVFTPVE